MAATAVTGTAAALVRCRAAHPSGRSRRRAGQPTAVPAAQGRSAGRRDQPQRSVSCCSTSWQGTERAHCCRRTGGCGEVFDDVRLFDLHRRRRCCTNPDEVGLATEDGVWRAAR